MAGALGISDVLGRRPGQLSGGQRQAVRLAPYPALAPGHHLAVSVHLDDLHFFDGRGDRIDVGWR